MNTRTLRAGVAALPLVIFALSAQAADLLPMKAPLAPVLPGETRLFVEGGAFWTGGDPIHYTGASLGLIGTVDPSVKPDVGWDVAVGFDHRFAGTPWHINGQFRYGQAEGSDAFFEGKSIPQETSFTTGTNSVSAKLKEQHWFVDLGGGYQLFSGPSPLQLNFGVRVAEITAKVTTTSNTRLDIVDPPDSATVIAGTETFQRRSFLGAGPRVGIDGSFPLIAGWTFDYAGNAAVLFGNTKISTDSASSVNVTGTLIPAFSVNGVNESTHWSKTIAVGNVDAQAGFGYWLTPNMKLAASYRLDAFFGGPLRQSPDSATNAPQQSIDRYYHGPKLTLTSRF
jgi:hypothetical protein